jgi:hypothetical protein
MALSTLWMYIGNIFILQAIVLLNLLLLPAVSINSAPFSFSGKEFNQSLILNSQTSSYFPVPESIPYSTLTVVARSYIQVSKSLSVSATV